MKNKNQLTGKPTAATRYKEANKGTKDASPEATIRHSHPGKQKHKAEFVKLRENQHRTVEVSDEERKADRAAGKD